MADANAFGCVEAQPVRASGASTADADVAAAEELAEAAGTFAVLHPIHHGAEAAESPLPVVQGRAAQLPQLTVAELDTAFGLMSEAEAAEVEQALGIMTPAEVESLGLPLTAVPAAAGLARFRRAANLVRAANQFRAAGARRLDEASLTHRPAAYSKYKHKGAKLRVLSGRPRTSSKKSLVQQEALARFRRAATTVRAATQFQAAGARRLEEAAHAHRPAAYSTYRHKRGSAKLRSIAHARFRRATIKVKAVNQFRAAGARRRSSTEREVATAVAGSEQGRRQNSHAGIGCGLCNCGSRPV
jgi:hypothetical protein